MGLKGFITGEKESKEGEEKETPAAEGKYDEPCAMCGEGGTEKKWMGQYWHKKCLRGVKKGAKGML